MTIRHTFKLFDIDFYIKKHNLQKCTTDLWTGIKFVNNVAHICFRHKIGLYSVQWKNLYVMVPNFSEKDQRRKLAFTNGWKSFGYNDDNKPLPSYYFGIYEKYFHPDEI